MMLYFKILNNSVSAFQVVKDRLDQVDKNVTGMSKSCANMQVTFLIQSWKGFNDGHHYRIHFIQARLSASKTVTSELMRKTTEVQSSSKTLQLQVGFKNTATLLYKLMCYNWKTCHNIRCERWFQYLRIFKIKVNKTRLVYAENE